MFYALCILEPLRVFVPVQVLFELTFTHRQQGLIDLGLRLRPPSVFVAGLRKSPTHDVHALLQHFTAWQDQHRHGAFGGQGQHLGGLVTQ